MYPVFTETYIGHRMNPIGSWIMVHETIPVADYQQLAKEFNPINFGVAEWVRMEKGARMKYIVIMTKQHEGFSVFETNARKCVKGITLVVPLQRN